MVKARAVTVTQPAAVALPSNAGIRAATSIGEIKAQSITARGQSGEQISPTPDIERLDGPLLPTKSAGGGIFISALEGLIGMASSAGMSADSNSTKVCRLLLSASYPSLPTVEARLSLLHLCLLSATALSAAADGAVRPFFGVCVLPQSVSAAEFQKTFSEETERIASFAKAASDLEARSNAVRKQIDDVYAKSRELTFRYIVRREAQARKLAGDMLSNANHSEKIATAAAQTLAAIFAVRETVAPALPERSDAASPRGTEQGAGAAVDQLIDEKDFGAAAQEILELRIRMTKTITSMIHNTRRQVDAMLALRAEETQATVGEMIRKSLDEVDQLSTRLPSANP